MSTNSSEDKSHDKKITRRDFLKLAGGSRSGGDFTISYAIWQGLWRYQE